jgi:hypothetical protein
MRFVAWSGRHIRRDPPVVSRLQSSRILRVVRPPVNPGPGKGKVSPDPAPCGRLSPRLGPARRSRDLRPYSLRASRRPRTGSEFFRLRNPSEAHTHSRPAREGVPTNPDSYEGDGDFTAGASPSSRRSSASRTGAVGWSACPGRSWCIRRPATHPSSASRPAARGRPRKGQNENRSRMHWRSWVGELPVPLAVGVATPGRDRRGR